MMQNKAAGLLIVFLVFSIGCTAGLRQQAPSRESESLREAVQKYYTYRQNRDFRNTFSYENYSLDPKADFSAYSRGSSTANMEILGFKILDIGEEGKGPNGGTIVKMKLTTTWPTGLNMPFPKGDREMTYDDLWVKKEGKWYHIIRGTTGGEW